MTSTEMRVYGFTIDGLTRKPVVLLKDAGKECTIPIWISFVDAISIAAELISRDLTTQRGRQDLMGILLREAKLSITGIALNGYNDGAFTATVSFSGEGREIVAEVRGSDAIVASLKFDVPIMVAADVIAQASVQALSDEDTATENDARRFVDYLENLKPEDLGKYPM